jgi:phage FluMu gp28-like protein
MTLKRKSREAKPLPQTTSIASASASSGSDPLPSPPTRIEVIPHDFKLPPVIQLRPYQQRWIDDRSRFKLSVKSARIGYSYATGVDHIFRRLENGGSTTTVLSPSQAQSTEFVDVCKKNIQAIGAVAQVYDEAWKDDISATDFLVQRIQFANGSRIMALAANPRTARGYPGDAVLDEYAHQMDSYAIWAAIFRQVALGNRLDVLSTPNGEQGKFFDLAKDLGLSDGFAPSPNPTRKGPWSGHWIDVNMAVADGCPINIEEMREGIKDNDTWSQEFLCVFLKATGAWLPIELIQQCEDSGATVDWPAGYAARGALYSGIDVARDHDQTVLWMVERLGDIRMTRLVLPLHAFPFPKQYDALDPWVRMTTRTAIDSTGMGIALYDLLNQTNGGRVMGVSFGGTNDNGVRMKVDLAVRFKRILENAHFRLPYDPQIRIELQSVKREATSTGVRFDAPRIELESAVAGGAKRKIYAHADRFWAASLAEFACDNGLEASMGSSNAQVGGREPDAGRGEILAGVSRGGGDFVRRDRRSRWA